MAASPEGTLLTRITGTDLTSLPSPEMSAPARHIEHSIDYSTGKASIAIPLHVYSTGLVSVPIVLRGQTGAVKVDEESGNIGKGWELDCGGFVARSIVGMPDRPGKVEVRESRVSWDLAYLDSLTNYVWDSHYDRYTYMAGGYSGMFIYRRGQIVKLTENDCSIDFLPGGLDAGFLITTPDGTRYRYDIPELQSYRLSSLQCSALPHAPNYDSEPCMWRLSSITDRTGTDKVTFIYEKIADCVRTTGGSVYNESIKKSTTGNNEFLSSSNGTTGTSHQYTYRNRHILKTISGRAGDIKFTHDSAFAYNPITFYTGFSVESGSGRTVRKVDFSHIGRASSEYNHDILLKGYRVTCGDTLIDGATFTYYYEDDLSLRKDFFGFCNKGAHDIAVIYLKLSPGGEWLPPGVSSSYDHIEGTEADLIKQGYIRTTTENYNSPCESVIYVHNDSVLPNPFRKPHPQGVLHGALHTVEHASGTITEFEYEPATVPDTIFQDHSASIGLRLVKEKVTDLNTGMERVRTLSYGQPKSSYDLSKLTKSNFIAVSGIMGYEGMGGSLFPAAYTTTGVTLTTCNRFPGASPENAVAYHGKVRETITGDGLDWPVVTDYEYDLTDFYAQSGAGGQKPSVSSADARSKYAGAEYESEFNDCFGLDSRIHPGLYGMHFIRSYEKEIIGERAPLKRVTEYVCEDGSLRKLRVTEIATSFDERTVTVGYNCEPIVRNIYRSGITYQYQYDSVADFCHFPIEAVVRRAYTDSEKVTEYDSSGNSRTVSSSYTYNNHGASVASNGLPYRTVTSCGDQSQTTTLTYASTIGSGLEAKTDAIALPVSETLSSGQSTTERRISYDHFPVGDKSPSGLQYTILMPSDIVTRHKGAAVDSINIHSYDSFCNPRSASHNGNDTVNFVWGHDGTLLLSVTTGQLTTKYTHEPLVGCTSVTSPAGTVRSFAYRGGRLWKEMIDSSVVAEHSYRLYASDEMNSITTRILTGPGTGPCTTVRSDAFGNPMARCISSSPSSQTGILTISRHDALSRQLKQYMPFQGSWTDDFATMESNAASAYTGDNAPFIRSSVEASASGRKLAVTLGGRDFDQYPVNSQYMFNTASGEFSCRRYTTTQLGGGSLKSTGYWPKGTLAVTRTSDHDGRATYMFTDFRGRTVMERRTTGGTPAFADTHYVYDDAGNLVFILTPAASAALSSSSTWNPASNTALKDHAYIYTYDTKNRVVSSRSPGVDETFVWYDLTGSQVFSQDPLQRQRGVMSFSFTDGNGRPAVSGECAYSAPVVGQAESGKLRAALSPSWSGAFAGYAVQGISLSGAVAHSAIYYDGYGFLDFSGFLPLKTFKSSKGYNPLRTNSAGVVTGSYSRLLGAEGAVLSVSYHDSRERTVRTVSSAMPTGFLVTETKYSNSDKPLSVIATHYHAGGASNSLQIDRTYDGYDRQSGMTVKVNGTAVTSTADTYSPNGRLAKTTFGNAATNAIEYAYTTRGDIASITAPDFTQTLTYSADSCRNGNIRFSSWKGVDGIQRSYRFSYDGMNRLTRSAYTESGRQEKSGQFISLEGTPDYTESMAYDLSSNPVRIRRYGINDHISSVLSRIFRFGLCDDISLTYSGERLLRADDSAPECGFSGATDFLDGASASVEYTYDANGNMTSDANKGIDAISYNRLNLPQSISMGQYLFGFVHDSSGNLVQRTENHQKISSVTPYSIHGADAPNSTILPNPWLTDTVSYCGPFKYGNGKLSRVNFPGGYISGDSAYHYIMDHQGNVRQVVNAASGNVLQENHYYPGGMLFAESTARYLASGSASNPFRFGGKEFITHAGLHLSLHGARMYDPALSRFITPDPLRHETPHLSAYLYCAANPVMLTDPTGMSTRVVDNGDGRYMVVGGALDGDLRIFLCESAYSVTGTPIGVTPVETSFYTSDKNGGTWMKGAIIDPNDDSGDNFINSIIANTPDIVSYGRKASGGKLYDFKRTNGTSSTGDDVNTENGLYRGMPVQFRVNTELQTFCSARDIGNIVAGYVMGYNGLPWKYTRLAFDIVQSIQDLFPSREGVSSQNAQWFGYNFGQIRKGRLNQRHIPFREDNK